MKITYIISVSQGKEEENLPIFQMIAGNKENGEARVLIVLERGGSSAYGMLRKRLGEQGIRERQIRAIPADDSGCLASLKLMLEVMKEVQEESLIYIDATGASQIVLAALLYAADFAEKGKACEAEWIYCRESAGRTGCDLVSLKLFAEIAEQMETVGICKTDQALDRMFYSLVCS